MDDASQAGVRRADPDHAFLAAGVFVLIGPIVGGFVFDPRVFGPPFTLVALMFSYGMGFYPAAAAGTLFALTAWTLVRGLHFARVHTGVAVLLGAASGAVVAGAMLLLWNETMRSIAIVPGATGFSALRYLLVFVVPGAVSAWVSASLWPIGSRGCREPLYAGCRDRR